MTKRNHEPQVLRRGKEFHTKVQSDWSATTGFGHEVGITDLNGRRRRVDILVEMDDDSMVVIEIKRTDWDQMKPHRIRPNALRHARQVWRYTEHYVEAKGRTVCPFIIYEHAPRTAGRATDVEAILGEDGIQVVWEREFAVGRQARNGKTNDELSA